MNRLFINLNNTLKKNIFKILQKFFKKSKTQKKINIIFFLFFKKRYYDLEFPNRSSLVRSKCIFTGYSRGNRWSMSRLNILIKSFRGDLCNIGTAR
jgi:hypothetical protein